MSIRELSFAGGESSLPVRRFAMTEAVVSVARVSGQAS